MSIAVAVCAGAAASSPQWCDARMVWFGGLGTLLGPHFRHRKIAPHRRIAGNEPGDGGFPRAGPAAKGAASRLRNGRSSTVGRSCCFEILKFSTLSDAQMLARVEFDGNGCAARRTRRQGRAARHRPIFGYLGIEWHGATRPALRTTRASWPRTPDIRNLNQHVEQIRQRHRQHRHFGRGRFRRVMRMLQAQGAPVRAHRFSTSRSGRPLRSISSRATRAATTAHRRALAAQNVGALSWPVFALPAAQAALPHGLRTPHRIRPGARQPRRDSTSHGSAAPCAGDVRPAAIPSCGLLEFTAAWRTAGTKKKNPTTRIERADGFSGLLEKRTPPRTGRRGDNNHRAARKPNLGAICRCVAGRVLWLELCSRRSHTPARLPNARSSTF